MMADFDPNTARSRIDLAEEKEFDVGGLHVIPAHREVSWNGEQRILEPRVAQVFVALASARPSVVSRDRLIEQVWEGRVVGDDAINRCIQALRQLARDFTPSPFAIETVPRVGYRLVEKAGASPQASKPGWSRRTIGAIIAFLVLAAVLGLGWSRLGRDEAAPASIAVLSFRNLSGGDPYFAEGVGEEILARLAREPEFRVVGRTSASQLRDAGDVRGVARRLHVDYVLEGSVRTQGNRVRVSAGLVRASDGVRLWADSYDGTLDDVFAIQGRIGGAVAGALRRRLARTTPLSGPLVTNGEAYNLYLTARGLLRTNDRRVGATAANLLRDALNFDRRYAPAWASLAVATQLDGADHGSEGMISALGQARLYARNALRLAPDLAEAHMALGMASGYGTPEAQFHLRRAAALDPNNADNMIWLGVAHRAAGEFDRELAAYRRAFELDPIWSPTGGTLAMTYAEDGRRAEAEAIAMRRANEVFRNQLLGRIAWIFGDFSEAARTRSLVTRANSPRWSRRAREDIDDVLFAVGLAGRPSLMVPSPPSGRNIRLFWMDAPPAPAVWQARNRNTIAAEVYHDDNVISAKLMLNAGRIQELVAAYDGPVGLIGLRPRVSLRADQLNVVPVVALVLRQAGRASEADTLLRAAEAIIRSVDRQGRIPFWFDADAAAVWAVQGRLDEALSRLERAIGRGWRHAGSHDLRDIADESAFRTLRGHPRFERIRSNLVAHFARERRETAQLRL